MTVYQLLSKVPQGNKDFVHVRTYDDPERDVVSLKLCRSVFDKGDMYMEDMGSQVKDWIVYGVQVRNGVLTVLAYPN